jgi:nitrite reductase/ring-hydroxylating ferredoxin subunit
MSIDVGPIEDFAEGTVRIVRAAGREIGIIRWAGAVYALNNLCSHQSGPVCTGILGPHLTARRPGEMELDPGAPVLACPWHGWEFDVRTGRALHDPRHSIRTFPVRLAGDRVLVEL